ncbi:hypothetical protein ABGB18_39640 [Nonomuraea sp. B12E4]|uniref:hypothetical protein n=1 Tax=Nonomuraea sp. B12E4 TaxID=3153564 RepID=UPI00325EDA90
MLVAEVVGVLDLDGDIYGKIEDEMLDGLDLLVKLGQSVTGNTTGRVTLEQRDPVPVFPDGLSNELGHSNHSFPKMCARASWRSASGSSFLILMVHWS